MSTKQITRSELREHVRSLVAEAVHKKHNELMRGRVAAIVETTVRKMAAAGMLKEDDSTNQRGDDSKRKSVMTMLRDDKYNHAELMRELWHPSSQEEEDTLRSLFSKCATGTPDADGAVRSFSEEEINKLYELLRKH